jgi:neurexin
VKFDKQKKVLFGLPLSENVGRHDYIMAAIDRKGKIAKDVFQIVVQKRPFAEKINHEFSLTLDADYRKFRLDVDKRLDLARKLAGLYGDNDVSKITVTRIEEGSVVYSWTNNSVPHEPCPTSTISYLQKFLITDDYKLNPALVEAMKPYRVTKAGVVPLGVCVGDVDKPDNENKQPVEGGILDPDVGESRTKRPEGPGIETSPRETSDEDVLVTTVIPAVVIAAMLLLAGCIACILYRKKRKGKMSDEDQHTFVNKGVPIIFADELEEKPSPPTKPLILQDEKPPMPPPGYNRAGSTPSTPRSDHKDPLDFEDDRDDLKSPLYQPPPPFTPTNRDPHRSSRPRQASHRHPPPYVPP